MSYTIEQGYVKGGQEVITSRAEYPGEPRRATRLEVKKATGRDYHLLGITHLVERIIVEGEEAA